MPAASAAAIAASRVWSLTPLIAQPLAKSARSRLHDRVATLRARPGLRQRHPADSRDLATGDPRRRPEAEDTRLPLAGIGGAGVAAPGFFRRRAGPTPSVAP